MIAAGLLGLGANVLLVVLAWRGKVVEQRILSVIALAYVAGGVHDLLAFREIIETSTYYADVTAFTNTLGIAAVLAWRYARNQARIREFNLQLQREVEAARAELAGNLKREHEVEMAHARIGDRLTLVRDIHDGLGGSLMGSIAEIEHAPEKVSIPQLLKLLKELRDELRLIVDSSIHETASDSLAERLAPLRHRMTRLLDASGIRCDWEVSGLEALNLPSNRALDVLRFLQEALTNVLKHSGADRVGVAMHNDTAGLRVEVRDNGRGLGSDPGSGAGSRSMQARAERLGGRWQRESAPGRTLVAILGIPTGTEKHPI
jgi:signal transduction histidine kinase